MNETEKIQRAWELRYAGRVAEAAPLLAELEACSPLSPSERAEVLLLRASFDRHALRVEEARTRVQEARVLLKAANLPASFQLCMQDALCHSADSRQAECLQLMQEAARLARTDFELILAKVNLAISLYNLELPFATLLAEVEPSLAREPGHPLQAAAAQLRLVKLKTAVQAGDFSTALALPFPTLSQGLYAQAWIESLPFFAGAPEALPRFMGFAAGSDLFFQKEYRLQTLRADPRLARGEKPGTLEVTVDRLYLWTWRWLENPASAVQTLLAEELARFPFATAHVSLASEDCLLLRSLGGWLSLFNPQFASGFRTWRDKYLPALPPTPFFDLELGAQRAVETRSAEALGALAQAHPSHARFFALLAPLAAPELPTPEGHLEVRVACSTLELGGERIVSEPMARLLAALVENGSVPFAAVAADCFGLAQFDSFVHGPKIHNLLQRLKPVLPAGARLTTKNQRVFLEGAEWIVVRNGGLHHQNFPAFDWPEFGKKQSIGRQKKQKVDLKARFLSWLGERQTVTRAELEEGLALPKATANRLLKEWTAEGFLVPQGAGASRVYSLKRS